MQNSASGPNRELRQAAGARHRLTCRRDWNRRRGVGQRPRCRCNPRENFQKRLSRLPGAMQVGGRAARLQDRRSRRKAITVASLTSNGEAVHHLRCDVNTGEHHIEARREGHVAGAVTDTQGVCGEIAGRHVLGQKAVDFGAGNHSSMPIITSDALMMAAASRTDRQPQIIRRLIGDRGRHDHALDDLDLDMSGGGAAPSRRPLCPLGCCARKSAWPSPMSKNSPRYIASAITCKTIGPTFARLTPTQPSIRQESTHDPPPARSLPGLRPCRDQCLRTRGDRLRGRRICGPSHCLLCRPKFVQPDSG